MFGSEFTFKEEIKEVKELVKISNKKGLEKNISTFETFDFSTAYRIIEEDHILALASLRMEIEKKYRYYTILHLIIKTTALYLKIFNIFMKENICIKSKLRH